MQLVHEIAELQIENTAAAQAVKTAVRSRPGHSMQHGVENDMDRVARDKKVNRQIRVQDHVLHRVHRVP